MKLRDFPAFYPEPEMIEGAPAKQRLTDRFRPHPTVMAGKVQAELHPKYVGSDALLSKNLRTKKAHRPTTEAPSGWRRTHFTRIVAQMYFRAYHSKH